MHDFISHNREKNTIAQSKPRRVNDCFTNTKNFTPPQMLFGEFWREGELALMFGAFEREKSVLAMQIAESIARGRPINGFTMTTKRPKTLYVDLILSENQLQMRYTKVSPNSPSLRHYEFSKNLYRDRPPSNDELCRWLRKEIQKHGHRVVVIDDLNAIRETYDGTRETLKLMRELKKLKDELEVSILVLSGSREPVDNTPVSEADMMRSRVVCDAVDSVFAFGRHPQKLGSFYLIQTRSRGASIVWTPHNAPVCRLKQAEDGYLHFEFDKRFKPEMDEKLRELICNIKWRRDQKVPYHLIADEFEISISKAIRLGKKWSPDLDPPESAFDKVKEEMLKAVTPVDVEETAGEAQESQADDEEGKNAIEFDPLAHLKRSVDKNDREIFVEQEDENGKPIVWYYRDTTGQLSRYENRGFGPSGRHVDGPICLFNTS